MKCNNFNQIEYMTNKYNKNTNNNHYKNIDVIGLDTEANTEGRCFMVATSEGDCYKYDDFPHCLFSRKYRDQTFVTYNLKYDEGALLQQLSVKELDILRYGNKVDHNGYKYSIISGKCLTISKGKHSIHIYDMYNFFHGSLNYNAKKYLGSEKIDLDTNLFTDEYIGNSWEKISEYCIKDSELVKKLADLLIETGSKERLDMRKLYSTAYLSWKFFSQNCEINDIKRYWNNYKECVEYSFNAYRGGKFEVTEKGIDNYYIYDIVSAYPSEMTNLVDISNARIYHTSREVKNATYGFLKVRVKLRNNFYSPIALKKSGLCYYPVGRFETFCTLEEYKYIKEENNYIEIIDGYWICVDEKIYPLKNAISQIVKRKYDAKQSGNDFEYLFWKIIMNSLYGKFIQLIQRGDRFRASTSFNPMWAAIITANTRIKMCRMQNKYKEIVAVHTDSVISTKELPIVGDGSLGTWDIEKKGKGIILGCGIYQIDDKIRFRGVAKNFNLFDFCNYNKPKRKLNNWRCRTWKEVAFRNLAHTEINRFFDEVKYFAINFDLKRLWINDWKVLSDALDRKVYSIPYYINEIDL